MLKWDTISDGEKLIYLLVELFMVVDLSRNLFLLSELLLFFKQCLPLTSEHIWRCRSPGLASTVPINRNDGSAVNCAAAQPLLPLCPCYF